MPATTTEVEGPGGSLLALEIPSRQTQGGLVFPARFFQDLYNRRLGGTTDERNTVLYNPCLFPGDILNPFAENLAMILGHIGNDGDKRVNYIGGV